MPPRRIYYHHCVAAITADSIKNQMHKLPFKKTVIKELLRRTSFCGFCSNKRLDFVAFIIDSAAATQK